MTTVCRFAGRVAVVTGAGSGIGRATSRRLAEDGALVIAVDRNGPALVALADESNEKIIAHTGDISDPGLVKSLSATIGSLGGRLDILVNCAASGGGKPALETSDAEFEAFLDVNVTAQFRLSKMALSQMRAGGVIVNIASVFGEAGAAGMAGYSVSKAAVSGMTRQLATDYGPEGIRVVAVAPGLIKTGLTAARIESDEWLTQHLIDRSALRRVGMPEDVANVIAFLASDDAAFVTGVTIPVDGGWLTSRLPRRDVANA